MKKVLLGILLLTFGCTATPFPESQRVEGATVLSFVCADERTGELLGPIESCGCNVWDADNESFRQLGRVECLCEDQQGLPISLVQTSGCGDSSCLVRDEQGHLVPTEDPLNAAPCEARGAGKVIALVGGELTRTINAMLIEQPGVATNLMDLDKTIPGITGHFVDDMLVGLHPALDERAYFATLGGEGKVAIFEELMTVGPSRLVNLDVDAIVYAMDWQSASTNEGTLYPDSLLVLPSHMKSVVAYSQDAILAADEGATVPSQECYGISEARNCSQILPLPDDVLATALNLSPDGRWLVVGLSGQNGLAVFDRSGAVPPQVVELFSQGVDNCGDRFTSFLVDGECLGRSLCFDGLDNDNDGLVDFNDPDCEADALEGTTTECSDGIDNDQDGFVDREDLGCRSILDNSELNFESSDLCENGLDDDGDRLTDAQDPGCWDGAESLPFDFESLPACADGADNDNNGFTDFASGDTSCSHAGDLSEGPESETRLLTHIETADAPRFGEGSWQASVTSNTGEFFLLLFPGGDTSDSIVVQSATADVSMAVFRALASRADTIALSTDGRFRMYGLSQSQTMRLGDYPVFGGVPTLAEEDPSLWTDMSGGYGDWFSTLYVVVDGVALTHSELSLSCGAPTCSEDGNCLAGAACTEGYCVANQCDDGTCPDGASCRSGYCIAACADDGACSTGLACSNGFCKSRCAADETGRRHLSRDAFSNLELDAEGWTTFEPVNLGNQDPQLFEFMPGAPRLVQSGDYTNALGSQIQLTGHPTLTQSGRSVTMDPTDTVFFCNLFDQPTTAEGDQTNISSCEPAGFVSSFGSLRRESVTDRRDRLPSVLRGYDEVVVAPTYFEDLEQSLDFYRIEYEGTLPSSTSKHGLHGGLTDNGWTLNDPTQDFCTIGVQAGDMVLIERFRLNGGDLIECAPWVSPSLLGPPAQRLEPLRYKVAKVHAHALELLVDDRTTYHQFGRTTSQGPPHPAPALAAPPLACVFPGFTYEIRVADDQWLVSSSSRGYQHWWSSIDGSCQSDDRLTAPTRTTIDDIYSDGYVRFQISVPKFDELCDGMPCKPYLLDSTLTFSIIDGGTEKEGISSAVFASSMEWLPFDDRLYVLDATIGTVISVEGLDLERTLFFESGRLQ